MLEDEALELGEQPEGELELNTMLDENVFSVEELTDRIVGAINLLDHIDEYKNEVSKKRREIAWREFDLVHTLEEFQKLEEKGLKISAKGCRNITETIMYYRALRRILKVSDELIYEFQKRYNRLNNVGNRSMVRSDIEREKKRLTQHHRNRIYTDEELYKLADIKLEDIEALKEKVDDKNESTS